MAQQGMNEKQSISLAVLGIIPVSPERKLAHAIVATTIETGVRDGSVIKSVKAAIVLNTEEEAKIVETLCDIIYHHKVLAGIE